MVTNNVFALLYAFIGFGLLITVHEFGHFIFCKIFNINTPTFSIGMGPKVLERKIGQTNFRLSLIPIGGYVEIAGLSEVGQGEQKMAADKGEGSFAAKPFWQKFFVLCGGVIFNLLFAYIVYSSLFFVGIPKKSVNILITEQEKYSKIAQNFNLQAKDQIISINNLELSTEPEKALKVLKEQLIIPLNKTQKETIQLVILRDNNQINISLDVSDKKIGENFLKLLELKSQDIPGEFEKYNLIDSVIKGIETTNNWIKQMVLGIIYLIKSKSLNGAGGPIMILSKTFETAQKGFIPLLLFLAFISINLAIINILPLGALDGGQLLFAGIEAIIRREIPEIIKASINIASWVLLLSLILYLTYKDILNIFVK